MSCCKDHTPLRMTMSQEPPHIVQLVPVIKMKCQKNCENCRNKQNSKSTTKKRTVLVPLFLLVSFAKVWAQEATPARTFWDDPFTSPLLPLYLVTALVLITILLVLVVALYLLKILNLLVKEAEKEKAMRTGVIPAHRISWWQQWWDKMNAAVPVAHEQDIDLGHNFDGIRELDNHLPPWWKWLFIATIIWGVVYIGMYHWSGTLPLSMDEYHNEIAMAEEKARIFQASQPAAVIDENALMFSNDAAIIGKGKEIFLGNCVACHRNDGGGNSIGPNLTDEYWLHGGGIKNVFATIKTGVVEKGMPAWGKAMSPKDVRNVAFYIMSLQGSNPANAKAPQGQLFKIEKTDSTVVKSDSLIVKR